jgi:hypothetical protein
MHLFLTSSVDVRQQKPVELAHRFRIVESNGQFSVPSQTATNRKYAARTGQQSAFYDCPGFELPPRRISVKCYSTSAAGSKSRFKPKVGRAYVSLS